MKLHDWFIHARAAFDEVKAAGESAFRTADESGHYSELTQLEDRVLRAQAEMENVRRRAARDVENAHRFALERFASDLLPVLDSLEKAVEAGDDADAVGCRRWRA